MQGTPSISLGKVLVYLGFVVASLIAYGYQLSSENLLNHFPYIKLLVNPELYPRDFYVQEFTQFSPRYYYQTLVASLINLGVPLTWIYFAAYVSAYSSFVLGLFTLARQFKASLVTAGTFSFLCLQASVGTIGSVDLFRTEPIPAIWSMGFVIWGFVCCHSRRWTCGYLLFGMATLFQILVGVLPGILILPWLVQDAYGKGTLKKALVPLVVLGIFAGAVYIPIRLTGMVESKILDSQSFIHIYGEVRHPHHIIFSSFGHQSWRDFWVFIVSAALNIIALNSLTKEQKRQLFLPIIMGVFLLFLGYIFVEVYPITLFAKLQLARVTPFMQLFCLLGFSILAQELWQKRNLGCGVLLIIVIVLEPNIALALILLTLIFLNDWQLRNGKGRFSWIAWGMIAGFLLFAVRDNPTQAIRNLGWLVMLWGCLMIPAAVQKIESHPTISQRLPQLRLSLMYTIGVVPLLILVLGLRGWLPRPLQNPFDGRLETQWFHNGERYRLGIQTQMVTPEDSLILVPDSTHDFRAYSQRSLVFTWKSMPFTERGIQEWFRRLQMMEALAADYEEHTVEQLVILARQFTADYVLTRQDWHPEIPYRVVAREGDWLLFQVPPPHSGSLVQGKSPK